MLLKVLKRRKTFQVLECECVGGGQRGIICINLKEKKRFDWSNLLVFEMIKPNGRQFHLFFEYQIFCLQCLWNLFEMIWTWPALKLVSIVCGFFQIFSARPFLFDLLSCFFVPLSDSVLAVPRDPIMWRVCMMMLTILIAACVSPYVCAHVCRGSRNNREAAVNKYSRSN